MRTSRAITIMVIAAALVPLPATSSTRATGDDYKTAPLVFMEGPAPAKYAQFKQPGKCLVIRLPDEQAYYY